MGYKELFRRKAATLTSLAFLFMFSLVSMLFSSCSQKMSADSQGKLKIVTTTTMLYDLVSTVGGEYVEVVSLMGPGIDPHLYQASAGDVAKMQEADMIVYSGLHLEGKMGDVFTSLSNQGREIVCVGDGIDVHKLLAGENQSEIYDPHIWFDVDLWKDAAKYTTDRIKSMDPSHEGAYLANLEVYLNDLEELEQYVNNRIAEIPEDGRVLVTAHDAFRYFGNAYGFRVIGLQGISTSAEAGTADVSSLAAFIAENQIKAVFVESSVPVKNIEALKAAVEAQGFHVEIGGELYSDSLGDAVSGHDSYIGTFRANIDTIVDALK